ncbi:hypothetical protein ABFS83_14G045900 [Erythranthe nasuta]
MYRYSLKVALFVIESAVLSVSHLGGGGVLGYHSCFHLRRNIRVLWSWWVSVDPNVNAAVGTNRFIDAAREVTDGLCRCCCCRVVSNFLVPVCVFLESRFEALESLFEPSTSQ